MISLVVILDMLNTVCISAIRISKNDDTEVKPKADLGIIGSLWGVMLIIIVVVYSHRNTEHEKFKKVL